MEIFNLPPASKFNRVIPKNSFDKYASARQKKLISEFILRITWVHKLSPDTINLSAKEIEEIQIFKIELKKKTEVKELLDVIDKAIPYHIIFIIEIETDYYLSTSVKHPHPTKENTAVIDWSFHSAWLNQHERKYAINLRNNLDAVYRDFCIQLSESPERTNISLTSLVRLEQETERLNKEINRLKKEISSCKQFNKKVELNLRLKVKQERFHQILSK